MINLVIVGAVLIQGAIAKGSRVAGAVVGYLITTGILLWGLSVYGAGGQIEFFGIQLSEPGFVVACLLWYLFDTGSMVSALKSGENATGTAGQPGAA